MSFAKKNDRPANTAKNARAAVQRKKYENTSAEKQAPAATAKRTDRFDDSAVKLFHNNPKYKMNNGNGTAGR